MSKNNILLFHFVLRIVLLIQFPVNCDVETELNNSQVRKKCYNF